MKLAFFTIIAVVVSLDFAVARVGETEKEVVARYGAGAPSDIQRQAGAETFKYLKNNFQIEVVMLDGKSIWEIIQKQDGDKYISDKEIKTILDGYKVPGQTWTFNIQKKVWARSGKPKYIAYRWPDHEDYLCIKDIVACETLEKANGGAKGL